MENIPSTLISRLEQAFRIGLDLDSDTRYEKLEFAKSPTWDSIAHLHLIAAIEKEFDIMIDTRDVLNMSSYLQAIEMVQKYVSNRSL